MLHEQPSLQTSPTRPDTLTSSVVARLATEFGHPAPVLRTVVRRSRRDLSGVPVGALPELLERLARQRLIDSVEV